MAVLRTIVWAIGYWIVYPAWPLVSSYTTGLLGWHSRAAVVTDLDALKALRAPMTPRLTATALADIKSDQALADFTLCAGPFGIPRELRALSRRRRRRRQGLSEPERQRLAVGRHARGDPAYDRVRHPLRPPEIAREPDAGLRQGRNAQARGDRQCRELRARDRQPADTARRRPRRRQKGYADNCAVCHGQEGKGNKELGSPDLTDGIWLFGSDEATIIEVIANSRAGVMPAWTGRLDPVTIKALTYYVHSLGGGEK